MIDVTAKLVRGPVYLAGEAVECYITFSSPLPASHVRSQSNSDVFESLAWASAQIHCQCTTNNKVAYPESSSVTPEELSTANADGLFPATSFAPCRGETGHIVLSTKPKILFCDLRLASGESKSYLYSEVLPNEAPPSYRGQAVKYSYKITIGMQRVNSPIKLLRVPLRVLVVNGLPESGACGDSEDLSPSNPFLETQRRDTPLTLAMQVLQNVTARRSPNFYNITNAKGKVVRFCLFKQAYKLGEDIVGTFDFTDSTVPCVQFSVMLQSEEEIAPSCRRMVRYGPAVVSYNKYHEMCLSLKCSQMILPIPLHITPAFSTELVSLRWRLHFEFVTCPSCDNSLVTGKNLTDRNVWQGPASLDIETMVWNLPIKIYPTTPLQVSQGLQAQAKHSIII
ncbi:RAB6A-GEF complex partner protein 2 isoform X2 [Schistocerca americana]|uniref:RAB6A-GEF complex partner protein 2 isoform X2 n=1 Tax=Schistocerca americana TaxID=7009 RepID=UPI001F4F8EE6|nr:RAB6A-GEF complex partner protein 2 isoform X2 [Schistocerca americana]XP_047114019.1 RAB6A-GEF complex partner protein 2 isoform X2 [Schistocerca piceifrons]XP_049776883.1 RAB6A-GEF complex partner protein 2 isoform X2 [Schistocerca cancellata]XP_049789812.1 RAB6A-GEF complex partner protein 2 isoform X2 [Schistocerca nitens]XP_049953225.1 RAB6A-GEF complex partner protein 2 isoform X2 [Schistocerca serialis cubense]